jgi:hypothetical protein
MTRIHTTVDGNPKVYFKNTSFSASIFKLILKKTRDNLTSTSVKVVPLTVTSMQNKFQQKIMQFGCATAQKLLTVRCMHALFDGERSVVFGFFTCKLDART